MTAVHREGQLESATDEAGHVRAGAGETRIFIHPPARLRVASYAVWETVVFVLNVLAFILIGLQLEERDLIAAFGAADAPFVRQMLAS